MIKVGINGFGRIGRPAFRRIIENHPDLEVVGINDLADAKTLAHLLKYDSIYGKFSREASSANDSLIVGGKEIKVFAKKDPSEIPWQADIVLECTGQFADMEGASKHKAKLVIISAPAKDKEIPSYLLGVNEKEFNPSKDKVIDMASCTTNCLAPIAKVLNDSFKIVSGFMTTTHSYTNDQKILDLPHKDLRRARAAALNIIPTSTGAAKAIGKVIPDLEGKLDGIALRVPTPTVSFLDLVVKVEKKCSVEEINKAFEKAASSGLKGIMKYETEPLVSSDFIADSHSSIFDSQLTMANGDIVKVAGWYDNEYGYACRLAEMAEYCGKRMK